MGWWEKGKGSTIKETSRLREDIHDLITYILRCVNRFGYFDIYTWFSSLSMRYS